MNLSRAFFCLAAFLWAVQAQALAAREAETHVYVAQHRTPQELAPLAAAVLGELGSVAVDGSSLVLVGPVGALERAADVLAARDIALELVTLHLEARSTASLRAAGHRIRWRNGGDLRAGALVPARAAARSITTARDEHTGFSLRVRDGATGRIDMGRSVPVLARGFFGGDTTVVAASSELLATPHVLGDGRVSVELAWTRRDVDDAGRRAGDGGQTTVVVRPGEALVLGSASRKLDSPASRSYGARSTRAQSDEQVILLRVEVE